MAGAGPQPVIVHTHLMVWQRYVARAASAVKRASRYIICDTLFLMNTYFIRVGAQFAIIMGVAMLLI